MAEQSRLNQVAAVALMATASLAAAQQPAYPVKAIRLIASQAPGGGIDTVARIVSSRLSESVGQTVIVDNRAGANGSLAGELTAKSPPDGYTVMLGALGNLGVNAFFIKNMTYDPLQDLAGQGVISLKAKLHIALDILSHHSV